MTETEMTEMEMDSDRDDRETPAGLLSISVQSTSSVSSAPLFGCRVFLLPCSSFEKYRTRTPILSMHASEEIGNFTAADQLRTFQGQSQSGH